MGQLNQDLKPSFMTRPLKLEFLARLRRVGLRRLAVAAFGSCDFLRDRPRRLFSLLLTIREKELSSCSEDNVDNRDIDHRSIKLKIKLEVFAASHRH